MSQTDLQGRPYAKLSELKAGDTIEIDGGFSCASPGRYVVKQYELFKALYFECDAGRHYLDGQADDGEHCVGIYKVEV